MSAIHLTLTQQTTIILLILILTQLAVCLIVDNTSKSETANFQPIDSPEEKLALESGLEIDARAAQSGGSGDILSATSHRVVASGWPQTSPMWPTIETADPSSDKQTNSWLDMVEPFIYADKPRSVDYSLLLTLNSSILELLKTRVKQPAAMNLSFEYYFNHDQKITALPGIKIEVDRKQFKYLEPNTNQQQQVGSKMWIKFNELITISDPIQLESHDWLKFSLVNRQADSLVAIRRLKVEFSMNPSDSTYGAQQDIITNQIQQQTTPVQQGSTSKSPPTTTTATLTPSKIPNLSPPDQSIRGNQQSSQRPPVENIEDPTTPPAVYTDQTEQEGADYTPAGSNVMSHKIGPVDAKNKAGWGWGLGKRRRRRDTSQGEKSPTTTTVTPASSALIMPGSIILTCYQSDQCEDWKADSTDNIQWSLARQPPSTNIVRSGYYYNSNRNNYGDYTKMLHLSLNQTESATIADQNSDHCIEVALYVTERTYLKLYQLTKSSNSSSPLDQQNDNWIKGNQLMMWAPTITNHYNRTNQTSQSMLAARCSLPDSRLPAMEENRNGWTVETLCYGDFFPQYKECGASNCAFGFEMETDVQRPKQPSTFIISGSNQGELDSSATTLSTVDQVVGVALLRDFSLNVPVKPNKPRWFETWQREEVEPSDNWKFYPKLDFRIGADDITLINLYDDSHYFIASDWLNVDNNLNFTATLKIDVNFNGKNQTTLSNLTDLQQQVENPENENSNVFNLRIITKLVDSKFNPIFRHGSSVYWSTLSNSSSMNLSISISERLREANNGELKPAEKDGLFKIMLEFVLECHWLNIDTNIQKFLSANGFIYTLTLGNVSMSDRCNPNPCEFGTCQQNGTGLEDWTCQCDEKHRGRRCEFGRWCSLPHVTPWNPAQAQHGNKYPQITLKTPTNNNNRQPKIVTESITRVSGKDFCQKKLGPGFKCSDVDLPMNDNLYSDEGKTFDCSCQDDYYLSDDSKCKQAHLCNSVICPAMGMICDESKAFNKTQPCQCNEKQDWFPDPGDPTQCVRQQCRDKKRDCLFDAHVCLPTLPGEKPICKCGPKFTLKTDEKGQKYCQSTACVLPTLNDCHHICTPDNTNLERPYSCSCHPGYILDGDGRSCRAQKLNNPPHCRPMCNSETQICTEVGCLCKQGFVGEGEVVVQQNAHKRNQQNSTANTQQHIDYVQSIRCLNVCSLTYAENKMEFDKIESVCPLGLCNQSDFKCRCSDPASSALVNTKYEPIYNSTLLAKDPENKQRISPLCHLKRVCESSSNSYQICKSQGAICVPDYTKAAMFDCICPPSTEKKFYGQGTSSEFTCEPRCSAKKYDCLRRQAVCKLVDKDQVKCDCLPGLMFDQHDQKCYLARYSYAFNLMIVNKYYEPESKFHKIQFFKNSTGDIENNIHLASKDSRLFDYNDHKSHGSHDQLTQLVPQFQTDSESNKGLVSKSVFITDFNQCNITQVIPKAVIEDPYEHDIESFLGYIDQCNEKIHQNVRNYHLNSRLSEDLRQALRQHIRDFTVTTNNSSCIEVDSSGLFLNCTVYLQSNEPIPKETIEYVFNGCDKHGQNDNYCWVKPRLLLKKSMSTMISNSTTNDVTQLSTTKGELNFHQITPCELNNFCGLDALSVKAEDGSSLCSCKCPADIEVVDVKELEPRRFEEDPMKFSVKEVCAPRNHCGVNSTFCLSKTGSICQYDIRMGSKCNCIYPSYEDASGKCVEVTFSNLDNTLIVIVIMLGTGLLVSIAINLAALAKSKSVFGRSKQYPLSEFPISRPQTGRSTGIPNPTFTND